MVHSKAERWVYYLADLMADLTVCYSVDLKAGHLARRWAERSVYYSAD